MKKHYLTDEKLSLKTKGLLAMMLSVPFKTREDLILMCKDSYTSIKSAINELEENRYIKINRKHKSGRFNYEYKVFEYKQIT